MPALRPRAGETLLLLSGRLWPALTQWLRRAQGATSARASLGLLSFPPFPGHVGSLNFGSFQLVDPVAASCWAGAERPLPPVPSIPLREGERNLEKQSNTNS